MFDQFCCIPPTTKDQRLTTANEGYMTSRKNKTSLHVDKTDLLHSLLEERILVLDGAMGTMIQALGLDERAVRGERFADHHKDLKNFADILCLTHPRRYHGDPSPVPRGRGRHRRDEHVRRQPDRHGRVRAAAGTGARDQPGGGAAVPAGRATSSTSKTPDKPRFVAGSIGPTTKQTAISTKVDDAGYRGVTFDQMVESYYEQVAALVEGGVDILLPETAFDTLNLKACLFAIEKYFDETGRARAGDGLGHVRPTAARRLSRARRRGVLELDRRTSRCSRVGMNCALGPGADAAVRREAAAGVAGV